MLQLKRKTPIGSNITRTILFLVGMCIMTTHLQAAICAFRNPDRDVYILFPEATNYKAHYRNLDKSKRKIMEDKLGQTLDINDVGTHTFYVILKDTVPIGFIHARAEWGAYGNLEVIWALNLDGTIKDFMVQRSREKGTKEIQGEAFREQFKNKGLGDKLVLPNTKKINIQVIKPVEGYQKTSSLIAYSAYKTLMFNQVLFGAVIKDSTS